MNAAMRRNPGATPPPASSEQAHHEFDRWVEEKKLDLEDRRLRQSRIDTWTRFVGTVAVGLLVTGGIQWYGMRNEQAARDRSESTQQAQVAIQLANARERALSDLRAQMFNALLQNYFKQATERERIAILELIGLNFRDAVQIKPMFELLDAQLRTRKGAADTAPLRRELRRAVRLITQDQLNQIRQAREGAVCRMTLRVGRPDTPECFPRLTIRLEAVDQSRIQVRTNSLGGALLAETDLEAGDRFEVTYFDMPMVDYTAVVSSGPEPWLYSVVLLEANPAKKTAEVALALLPVSAVGAQHRYAFDELLARYLNPVTR